MTLQLLLSEINQGWKQIDQQWSLGLFSNKSVCKGASDFVVHLLKLQTKLRIMQVSYMVENGNLHEHSISTSSDSGPHKANEKFMYFNDPGRLKYFKIAPTCRQPCSPSRRGCHRRRWVCRQWLAERSSKTHPGTIFQSGELDRKLGGPKKGWFSHGVRLKSPVFIWNHLGWNSFQKGPQKLLVKWSLDEFHAFFSRCSRPKLFHFWDHSPPKPLKQKKQTQQKTTKNIKKLMTQILTASFRAKPLSHCSRQLLQLLNRAVEVSQQRHMGLWCQGQPKRPKLTESRVTTGYYMWLYQYIYHVLYLTKMGWKSEPKIQNLGFWFVAPSTILHPLRHVICSTQREKEKLGT